jgi:hypothetical protein
MKDPIWLYLLSREEASTLVTYDNKMAVVHRDSILKRGSTLAVIDSKGNRGGRRVEEYKREVIHRWAHRMASQKAGSRFKYNRQGRREIKL